MGDKFEGRMLLHLFASCFTEDSYLRVQLTSQVSLHITLWPRSTKYSHFKGFPIPWSPALLCSTWSWRPAACTRARKCLQGRHSCHHFQSFKFKVFKVFTLVIFLHSCHFPNWPAPGQDNVFKVFTLVIIFKIRTSPARVSNYKYGKTMREIQSAPGQDNVFKVFTHIIFKIGQHRAGTDNLANDPTEETPVTQPVIQFEALNRHQLNIPFPSPCPLLYDETFCINK